jgi:phosphatidylinositol alpha-1,6-mannosyltransferase
VERIAAAVNRAWPGGVARVDLYSRDRMPIPAGNVRRKAAFAARGTACAARTRPGIVLSLDVAMLPAAAPAALASGASLAAYGAGREVWTEQPRARRLLAARCRRLLAISTFTADRMAERLGVERARVEVTPLPIEPTLEREARTAGAAATEPHLLTVCRVSRESAYKGYESVARCMPEVLRQVPGARWTVVGGGDALEGLRELCGRLGLDGSVSFTGLVPDAELPALYRSARALVMPSVTRIGSTRAEGEGFGLVYAEAGAFGVPSIASTAAGGAEEIVLDGVTGLTSPSGDGRALAAAIVRLLTDTPLRNRLGAAARRLVLERHTQAAYSRSLVAALS